MTPPDEGGSVVVVGAGGFGRETLDVIEAHNRAHPDAALIVRGIVDDEPSDRNLARLADRGYTWLGPMADVIAASPPSRFVLGIGSPGVKAELDARLVAAGWSATSVVHPSAVLGSVCAVGAGSVVCAGVQLSTHTRLGRHVHLNPGAIVGHDAELGDFVSVNPGAIISGEVIVHDRVLVGAGAVVLQGLQVGEAATVGASACVTRDVPAGDVVVGVPARSHRRPA